MSLVEACNEFDNSIIQGNNVDSISHETLNYLKITFLA